MTGHSAQLDEEPRAETDVGAYVLEELDEEGEVLPLEGGELLELVLGSLGEDGTRKGWFVLEEALEADRSSDGFDRPLDEVKQVGQ